MTNPRVALAGILMACPGAVSFADKQALLKEILSCESDDDLTKLANRWLKERAAKGDKHGR